MFGRSSSLPSFAPSLLALLLLWSPDAAAAFVTPSPSSPSSSTAPSLRSQATHHEAGDNGQAAVHHQKHLSWRHPYINRNVAQVCYEMNCNVREYKDIVATLEAQRDMLAERIEAIDDVLDEVYGCEDDGMKHASKVSAVYDIAELVQSIQSLLMKEVR